MLAWPRNPCTHLGSASRAIIDPAPWRSVWKCRTRRPAAAAAAWQRRAVERAAQARAEHVVVVAHELIAGAQPGEGLGRLVGDRDETGLPTLGRPFDPVTECALDHEPAVDDVDIGPTQGAQLPETQTRVRGDPIQIGVLAVLGVARGRLGGVVAQLRDVPVLAALGRTSKCLDLLRLVKSSTAGGGSRRRDVPRARLCSKAWLSSRIA